MWQYSHTGNVPGANISSGNCDMNYAYQDYPTLIKNAGLNGFTKAAQAAVPETRYNVSFSGISTKGEAETIKNKIEAMGYIGKIEVQK